MPRTFDKKNVILLRLSDEDLNSFLIDKDINDDGTPKYMLEEFARVVMNVIPEYVFGKYEKIENEEYVDKLREAANSIYKIKEFELMRRYYLDNDQQALQELNQLPFKKRGEFGELILHLLLRDFKETVPLISKVYFKDSQGVPAHGFDAVHVSPNEKILWLGESKLYVDGKDGIRALIKDLNDHFKQDYLNDQFIIIKKNLECNDIPQRQQWLEILNHCSKLSDRIKMINIPILCVYENDIYTKFDDLSVQDAIQYHETNIKSLKQFFDREYYHPLKTHLNVILLLFPVRNKFELIKLLHKKLWHMQSM